MNVVREFCLRQCYCFRRSCYVCVVTRSLVFSICVFGKLLDCAVYCIMVLSFCFLLGVSGSEDIL